MGPRLLRREARKLIRLMTITTAHQARMPSATLWYLAHPDHQRAAQQRPQVDARVEQAEARIAPVCRSHGTTAPPSCEMFGLKKPVPMMEKQVPM
jgi:hypothetical protein